MADDAAFESLQHRHVMSGYWSSADDAWMDVPAKAQSELSLGTSCIPRHIHLVWLGGSLPAMLRRVASSWQAAHPQWQVTLWDDEAVEELPLFNQAAFDTAPNRGFQADVLRYELLYRFGGFYADVDLLCLRSVAPLAALSSQGKIDVRFEAMERRPDGQSRTALRRGERPPTVGGQADGAGSGPLPGGVRPYPTALPHGGGHESALPGSGFG